MASRYEYIEVRLGAINNVSIDTIVDFYLETSIRDIIPRGSLTIADRGGLIWSQFSGLAIGSEVNIALLEEQQTEDYKSAPKLQLPTFYVTKVTNGSEFDVSLTAGNIVVEFAHPWALFVDSLNHAYKPQKFSDLIKQVLKNENRGVKFRVEDKNISTTDDDGRTSKYKLGETDFDFLRTKVLPFCSVTEQPAWLYCREDFQFMLKSFKQMYQQQPKIIFGPKEEAMPESGVAEQIDAARKNYGLTDDSVYPMSSLAFSIGDPSQVREFRPYVVGEVVNNGTIIVGDKFPGNALAPESGDNYGNVMPFDLFFGMKTQSTTMKLMQNKSMIDSLTLFFHSSKVLDDCFMIATETQGILNDVASGAVMSALSDGPSLRVQVGDTAVVVLPQIKYGEDGVKDQKSYYNWISGKWLITKTEHYLSDGDERVIMTRTYMSRPCFVGNKLSTSILDVDSMYKSKV